MPSYRSGMRPIPFHLRTGATAPPAMLAPGGQAGASRLVQTKLFLPLEVLPLRRQSYIALLLALLLAVACSALWAAGDRPPSYAYELVCTDDGTTTGSGVITLELYLRPGDPKDPMLMGGSFGLRFPEWMGTCCSFTPGEAVALRPLVPEERRPGGGEVLEDGCHGFAWTRAEDSWDVSWPEGGVLVGTYTFADLPEGRLPHRSGVGLMDFLDMDAAIPAEWGEGASAADDPYNRSVRNPETGLYQGYYLPDGPHDTEENSRVEQVDIDFRFEAPTTWPGALTVASYDPKKPMTALVLDRAGEQVAVLSCPRWEGKDSDALRAVLPARADSGVGRYEALIELNCAVEPEQTYTLVISKPGHLPVRLELTARSGSLSDADGLPDSVYLPCGDIAPSGGGGYGDEAIKLNDRAVLLGYLDGLAADYVPEKAADVVDGVPVNEGAWLADLNGDGSVTLADLDILMAGENFNQMTEKWEEDP